MKKKIKLNKLVIVILLLCLVGFVFFKLFFNVKYEDQTSLIERSLNNVGNYDTVSNVEKSVSYSGDGVYHVDALIAYKEYRVAGYINFTDELSKTEIKFKKIVLSLSDGYKSDGKKSYVFKDHEIDYKEFKKIKRDNGN